MSYSHAEIFLRHSEEIDRRNEEITCACGAVWPACNCATTNTTQTGQTR